MTLDSPRGSALLDVLLALTMLSVGLAPAAWVFARAERAVAAARAQERVSLAAQRLLVSLEGGAACATAGAALEREGVAVAWVAGPGAVRRVTATFRSDARPRGDTLVTAAWCP